jgi:hypothetical protein
VGTNSVRLFSPGEKKSISEVQSGVKVHGVWVDLLTDLKNVADGQEWDKQDLNFQRQLFANRFIYNEF